MLLSIALILLVGMSMGFVCKKIKLPALLGMIIAGILMGPYVFNVLDESILSISASLRRIALIIILMRAGLSLNVKDLKKVGRPAVLMCFLPACFEITGMIILAPIIFNISRIDAAIIGAVVAAVSPAVVVPKMIKLIETNYGTNKSIPQMILAAASVDDVFVIVMFSVFTSIAKDNTFSIMSVINIPVTIATGIIAGAALGFFFAKFFEKMHIRDTVKMLILFSTGLILVSIEDNFSGIIAFSGLIAIMSMGASLKIFRPSTASNMSLKFNKFWIFAEVFLFVLVGAAVDPSYAINAGALAILLILVSLVFRMFGVFICLLKTKLNFSERLFCMIAYCPKATVQASIGGIPLAMGLACGNLTLTVAVLAILITAPLGAFFIDLTYQKLLSKDDI